MNETDLRVHFFTLGVARKYGLNEAVILQNIYYWVDKNATNRRHFHDGRYWTYNSAAAFTEQFPYFSKRQIQYTLEKLEKHGLILVGNYNKQRFDQTRWYALTDKAYELFGQTPPQVTKEPSSDADNDGNSISQNCDLENTRLLNAISQNCDMEGTTMSLGKNSFVTPIPDRNTNRTSDGNGQMETQMAAGRARANDGGASAFVEKSRAFVRAQNLRVDADRFFETNALRGWTDKDGRPIHDWRRYLLAWAQYETPSAPAPSSIASSEKPKRSIEEIMEFYLCSREVAEEMVREGIV